MTVMSKSQERNGSASGPTHVVIGNAGYKLSWAANPRPPPYWATVALDHGFLRCDVNATLFYCEVPVLRFHGLCIQLRVLPWRSMQRHPLLLRSTCCGFHAVCIDLIRGPSTVMTMLPSSTVRYLFVVITVYA